MIQFGEEIRNVEQVKNATILVYAVSKEEIINKKYTRLLNSLNILKLSGKHAKEKLMLTFDGYDDDKREIYMIPEVREYVKYIYEKYNYIFYFLTSLDNNRSIIYACINDFRSIQNKNENFTRLEIISNKETRNKTVDAMLQYGIDIGDIDDIKRILYTFM